MAAERCGLLPADAATGLGLAPQGKEQSDPLDPEAPSPCVWNSVDGKNRLSLTPLDGRSIQAYYDNKSKCVGFQELSIAGHPSVRANQGDPKQDGTCDIFLATKERQILSAQAARCSGRTRRPARGNGRTRTTVAGLPPPTAAPVVGAAGKPQGLRVAVPVAGAVSVARTPPVVPPAAAGRQGPARVPVLVAASRATPRSRSTSARAGCWSRTTCSPTTCSARLPPSSVTPTKAGDSRRGVN